MKTSELIKVLKKQGCKLKRHGTNHDIWETKDGKILIVPRHKKEIPTGTADNILKEIRG